MVDEHVVATNLRPDLGTFLRYNGEADIVII